MVNLWSTISGFMSETVDASFKEKSFYELKPELPGTKGTYDFVSTPLYLHYEEGRDGELGWANADCV